MSIDEKLVMGHFGLVGAHVYRKVKDELNN